MLPTHNTSPSNHSATVNSERKEWHSLRLRLSVPEHCLDDIDHHISCGWDTDINNNRMLSVYIPVAVPECKLGAWTVKTKTIEIASSTTVSSTSTDKTKSFDRRAKTTHIEIAHKLPEFDLSPKLKPYKKIKRLKDQDLPPHLRLHDGYLSLSDSEDQDAESIEFYEPMLTSEACKLLALKPPDSKQN